MQMKKKTVEETSAASSDSDEKGRSPGRNAENLKEGKADEPENSLRKINEESTKKRDRE